MLLPRAGIGGSLFTRSVLCAVPRGRAGVVPSNLGPGGGEAVRAPGSWRHSGAMTHLRRGSRNAFGPRHACYGR